MNLFITGGCGFIGRNFIKSLEGKHISFIVYDNYKTGQPSDLKYTDLAYAETDAEHISWEPDTIKIIHSDILNPDLLNKVVKKADAVVHLAANTGVLPSVQDPVGDCKSNILGTLNVLEACRKNGIKRFVFASSGASVGDDSPPPLHEKLPPRPVSPYGVSKLAGEGYCNAYYRSFGIETVALRFGNVYGPGSTHKGSVVAKFIKRALKGDILEIYGKGSQTRDFIYICDLVSAIYKAVTVPDIGGEIFQIATGIETTVNELTEALLKTLKKADVHGVKVKNIDPQKGEVQRNYSDTSKAFQILDWKAVINLDDGLKDTIDYFIRNRAI